MIRNRVEKGIILGQYFEEICPSCEGSKEPFFWLCKNCSPLVTGTLTDIALGIVCGQHIMMIENYLRMARLRHERNAEAEKEFIDRIKG